MTRWVRNTMERVMEEHDLFHCSFCERAFDLSDRTSCEGPEDICLDCHMTECPTSGACTLEGNFA